MTKLYTLLPLALAAACNVGDAGPTGNSGPDAGQTALPANAGEVEGAVQGQSMAGVGSAFYIEIGDGLFAVVLTEGDEPCDPEADTGKILGFPFCGAATPGVYTISDELDLEVDCGTGDRLAESLFERPDGEDIDGADSGVLSIDSVSQTSVVGRFRAGFGSEQLTGRFNAVICD